MKKGYLRDLSVVIKALLEEPSVKESIEDLKKWIQKSDEPSAWGTIKIESFLETLPSNIKSALIFLL